MKPRKPTGSHTKSKQPISESPNAQNNSRESYTLSTTSDVFNKSIEMDDNDANYITLKKKFET